jgi:hypothetical protein
MTMRYEPKTQADLLKALGILPDGMLVEAETGTGISAKNVGELRRNAWPSGGLIVETPREPDRPESVVKITRSTEGAAKGANTPAAI